MFLVTWFFFFWITIKFTVNKNVVHLILLNHLVKTYGCFLVKALGRLVMWVRFWLGYLRSWYIWCCSVHVVHLKPNSLTKQDNARRKSKGFLQHETFMKARKSEDQSRRLCEMLKSCSLFADNPALWNIIMK